MNNKRLYSEYLGISKHKYPRWAGWHIIQEYKQLGVHPKHIEDERLFCCVQNFKFLLELQQLWNVEITK